MKRYLFLLFLILVQQVSLAQGTQTIRGRVMDAELKMPLIGVNVVLTSDTSKFIGGITDLDGYYRLEGVPLGKHTLRFSYVGYLEQMLGNIIVTSGKEVILDVELDQSAEILEGVEITAESQQGEALNEMATVSSRAFTIEETDRYAGSRGDPARMASNFAGVNGADDSRNDIVVRGNSPIGVLFRLEGVDIPNPNHFAIPGSGGGPVGILNNKVLGNSDFYTGAFPAEFGNAVAGVFDLNMRSGNNENFEFTGQFGFLGTEITAEGPINKEKRSSFLVNYRYSSLSIFTAAGIPIGTDAVPRYQDAAFKLNFPNKKGSFSVFGVGGASGIDILISDQEEPSVEIFGEQNKDQYFATGLGILGANYVRTINDKTYLRLTVAGSHEYQNSYHEEVFRHTDTEGQFVVDSLLPFMRYRFAANRISGNAVVNYRPNPKNTFKFGLLNDRYAANYHDTLLAFGDPYTLRWDNDLTTLLVRPYAQWKHKFSDRLTLNAGLHALYFSLNGSVSPIEPRVGLKWEPKKGKKFAFGYGLHSQTQPLYIYSYQLPVSDGSYTLHNEDIDLTKSHHFVLSYGNSLWKGMRFNAEVYYQYLYNVPIEKRSSSFSSVNLGSGFARYFPDTLQNNGTAQNYGLELTVEKFFSNEFFFMITTSLFESEYVGSDGVMRPTDFNGNWIANLLLGQNFKTGKRSNLSLGLKVSAAGGKRYSPVDDTLSALAQEIVLVDSLHNTIKLKDYFRTDLKINYRLNAKKVTHEIGLDLVNILNTKNILKFTYAPDPTNPAQSAIREEYQLGFLPIFYYKIDF